MSRLGVVAAMLIASVLGLIAGLFGILSVIRISKGKIVTASVCGIISAVIAAAGNVLGMLTGYTGYTFACRHGEAVVVSMNRALYGFSFCSAPMRLRA